MCKVVFSHVPCCVVGGSLDKCSQIQLGVRGLNVHPIESSKECAALSFTCRHDVLWFEPQTRAEVEYKDATGCARAHSLKSCKECAVLSFTRNNRGRGE